MIELGETFGHSCAERQVGLFLGALTVSGNVSVTGGHAPSLSGAMLAREFSVCTLDTKRELQCRSVLGAVSGLIAALWNPHQEIRSGLSVGCCVTD